jgi:predicted ArsR family transcriptional regulator
MKTTRQLILDYLENKHAATAREISHAMQTTASNIRHHLKVLSDEGAIQTIGCQPIKGRGRPTQLYALIGQVVQHNLDQLSSALLKEYLGSLPAAEYARGIERIAEHLAAAEEIRPGSLQQRFYKAILRLNAMKYEARWEAHSHAPTITLGHCPYKMILPEHPELCQMDAALIEGLLGKPVQQVSKLAVDSRGRTYCKFQTGERFK